MTGSADRATAAERFAQLHEGPEMLVLPNPWSQGTAKLFANLGYQALATTSAGLAFSLGRRDGDGVVSADESLEHAQQIVEATPLPVSADLENGFGESPEVVANTIRRAGEVGLVGASIEDATYRPEAPILDRSLAVERIHAAVEAARALPHRFMLTARAENFIRGSPDFDDTMERLLAFEAAGADVLFAPGMPDAESLRQVCDALQKPFNYVAGIGPIRLPLDELKRLGVRRVSIGTSFARTALHAVRTAAREVLEQGTFGYLEGVPSVADFNEILNPSEVSSS